MSSSSSPYAYQWVRTVVGIPKRKIYLSVQQGLLKIINEKEERLESTIHFTADFYDSMARLPTQVGEDTGMSLFLIFLGGFVGFVMISSSAKV